MTQFARHESKLDLLKSHSLYRKLIPRLGLDFSSNDYLALAGSDILRKAALEHVNKGVTVGSGGSRLLRGNCVEHQKLEEEAAAFFQTERALYFGSGYSANVAIFSTLPHNDDLVLYDEYIHASAHEGMRLGKAQTSAFDHNNVTHASDIITAWRKKGGRGRIWLAFESLYSMDGDFAPIGDLFTLAQTHDAILMVDEAHATGVFGDKGRGLTNHAQQHTNMVTLHTCGKALGVLGALVCGPSPLIETLINKARGFIFATAPSPLNAALVSTALRLLQSKPNRQNELQSHINHAHNQARELCGITNLNSQIIPVIIGKDKDTMALATRMQQHGYDIRGVRPPTVPRGTSRLRISITLNVSKAQITEMFTILGKERDLVK